MYDATLSLHGTASYLRRFPMLEADEEFELATRWRDHGDTTAADRLVTSHLPLVVKVAMKYQRHGLSTHDLISEGTIGLLHAVRRFDPGKGIRFSSYAIWWIKAATKEYVMRSRSLVKIGTTNSQRKLFFGLAKAKRRLSIVQEGDLRSDQVTSIANELGVAKQDVIDMDRRFRGDLSLNVPISDEGNTTEWQDRLIDEGSDQESRLAESDETQTRQNALRQALTVLTDRERAIFEARRLAEPPVTLDELSAKFCICREWVRQIEERAFHKVQKAARAAVARRQNPGASMPDRGSGTPRKEAARHRDSSVDNSWRTRGTRVQPRCNIDQGRFLGRGPRCAEAQTSPKSSRSASLPTTSSAP